MLRATTACNFSSLSWPAGSAPAALASLLFDPPEPRLSYLFSHLHLLSSYSFSSTLLSSSLSLLSASSLLCFSSVHIVGSLTSKLPSAKSQQKAEASKDRNRQIKRKNKTLFRCLRNSNLRPRCESRCQACNR